MILKSKRLSISLGLFHSFRLLTGAIHSLYLIKNGVGIKDIALLQIVYSITSLIFLYPIGMISDQIGPKKLSVISCLLLSSYYLLTGLYAHNFNILIIAHIVQSISLASIIGVSSWILESSITEKINKENYLNDLGYLENEIQAIGGIFAGIIGVFITYKFDINGYKYAYMIASLLLFLNAINFSTIKESKIKLSQNISLYNARMIISETLRDSKLLWYLISSGLIVAIYQSLFHFWQPLLNSCRNIEIDAVFAAAVCFISSNLVKYIMNKIARSKRFLELCPFSILKISIYFTIVGFASLYITESNFFIVVLIFSSLHGLLSVIVKIVNSQFLKIVIPNKCSSILSLSEIFGRIMGLSFLLFIHQILSSYSVRSIFLFTSILVILLRISIYLWQKFYNQSLIKPSI